MHPPTDVVPLAGGPDGCDLLVARLRSVGSAPVAPTVAAAHLGAIGRQASTRARRRRAAVAGVVAASLLLGSTSLAAAGVLPRPAQTAMSTTLQHLGIEVPATRRATDGAGARRGDVPAGRAIAERTGNGGADRLRRDRPARPRSDAGGGEEPGATAGTARPRRPAATDRTVAPAAPTARPGPTTPPASAPPGGPAPSATGGSGDGLTSPPGAGPTAPTASGPSGDGSGDDGGPSTAPTPTGTRSTPTPTPTPTPEGTEAP